MSENSYRLETDQGLSKKYTVTRLREKLAAGVVDGSMRCTRDDGQTWVTLAELIREEVVAEVSTSAEGEDTRGDSESASMAQSETTVDVERSDSDESQDSSLRFQSRKLRRLPPGGGAGRFAKLKAARQEKETSRITSPDDLVGVLLAGDRYKVVDRLGRGSMAYVLRAYDNRLMTDVVVKVPKPEKLQDPDIRDRFRRESQLLVQLTHPHVVKVLDVGEYNELPYVVMQYLSGGTLTDRIQSESSGRTGMPPDSLKTWLRDVARALDFCYRKGMVHRDVKPANILFDEDGNAYVSDFGLTKIMYGDHDNIDPSDTASGIVLGTPNYISPEVVLGRKYDGRADQYSLGITVYHALFGKAPMQGENATATMINQTQKRLQLLSDIRSDVSRELALAVRRSIEKDPEKRFSSCEEFAEAVIEGLRAPAGKTASVAVSSSSQSSIRSSQSSVRRRRPKQKNTSARSGRTAAPQQVDPDIEWLQVAASADDEALPPSRPKKRSSARTKKNAARKAAGPTVIFGQEVHPGLVVALGVGMLALVLSIIIRWALSDDGSAPDPGLASQADGDFQSGGPSLNALVDTPVDGPEPGNAQQAAARPATETNRGRRNKNQQKQGQPPSTGGHESDSSDTVAGAPADVRRAGYSSGIPSARNQASPAASMQNALEALPGNSGSGNRSSADKPPNAEAPAAGVGSRPDAGRPKPATLPGSASVPDSGPLSETRHEDSDQVPWQPGDTFTVARCSCPVLVTGNTVWNKSTASVAATLEGSYPQDALTALSPNGRWFAATAKPRNQINSDVVVWDTQTGKKKFTARGDSARYVDVILLSDEFLFVTGRGAADIRRWRCEGGNSQKAIKVSQASFHAGSTALSADGQFVATVSNAVLGVIRAQDGKVAGIMRSPGARPRVTQRAAPARGPDTGNSDVYDALQSLAFSDDSTALAGLSTYPVPRVLCWSSDGQLEIDAALPGVRADEQPLQLYWMADNSAWLIGHTVVDRSSGRVLAVFDGSSSVQTYPFDQLKVCHLNHDDGHVLLQELPWDSIQKAVQLADKSGSAVVSPSQPVSLTVTIAGREDLESHVSRALTRRLLSDGVRVDGDHQPAVFAVTADAASRLLTVSLKVNGTQRWSTVLPDIEVLDSAFATAEGSRKKALLDELTDSINQLVTPWFVSHDDAVPMLPVRLH